MEHVPQDTVSCEGCGKTVPVAEAERISEQPYCVRCFDKRAGCESVCEACGEGVPDDDVAYNGIGQVTCPDCLAVQRREYSDEAARIGLPTWIRCMDCNEKVERDAAKWHRRVEDDGDTIVVGVCAGCYTKAYPPPPQGALKAALDAMEREEFHLDDLLDALSREIEEGAKKGETSGRSCFVRALLDRLDDGDLAVELAFRLGEIADPFPQT